MAEILISMASEMRWNPPIQTAMKSGGFGYALFIPLLLET